jgi:hypothetical protein
MKNGIVELVKFIATLFVFSLIILVISFFLKGKNYSDVGISMYTNSHNAYVLGILLYSILSFLLIYFYRNKINITLVIGVLIIVLYFFIFQWVLAWILNSEFTIYIF